ncbi:MAG: NAD(P)/FAD-dependent oxidoreductase [Planctomycetota bacterium]
METTATVIGAGVVGLAVARELSSRGSVLVLEREDGIGRGVSSRNSEVVHAGLYYRPGSLKARLSVEGRRMIEAWAGGGSFPYRRVGKLLVATSEEEAAQLEALSETARENGVDDLRPLSASEVTRIEPDVRALTGFLSPSTGIVDSHGLMRYLLRSAQGNGAQIAFCCRVREIRVLKPGFELILNEHGKEQRLRTRFLVNAAGLESDRLAQQVGLDLETERLRHRFCRGEYFQLTPSCPVRVGRLVYPVPVRGGHLGIHLTVDLQGGMRLGPSLEFMEETGLADRVEDYRQDDRLRASFLKAARRYLPALNADHLAPGGVGIRPRLAGPTEGERDFYIREEGARGLPGLVNCIGIDSPGLTAAPAIGRHVAGLLDGQID